MILEDMGRLCHVVVCVCFFLLTKVSYDTDETYQIEARKGASIQVIGAPSFVKGKVDMVVAQEQG